jgi:hypothetical protein
MSKSNVEKVGKEEVGNQVVLFIYRIPKKNHDAIIQLGKQADELFKRQGALRLEIFQLNNGKTYEDMGFVNIAKSSVFCPTTIC